MSENKKVVLGILGFGTVGSGVFRVVTEGRDSILHRENLDMQVKRILIRNFDEKRHLQVAPREVFTQSIEDIVNDEEISVVCECLGGTEPARTYILACLNAGKTIVTSNKEVVAKHWPEFEAAAKTTGAGFYIEATAGGGVPIVRTLLDSMPSNNIDTLMGIVNGTTNYILTKMDEEGRGFDETLKEAQALGYAEANPAADVDGWDCVYKLAILGSIAFHARVDSASIYREGISNVSREDMAIARELGYTIRLLAIGKKVGGMYGKLELRVHPTMIPRSHPLSSVRGVFNAVFLHGDAVDDIMLYGRGAGQLPTASAVVADIIYASKAHKHRYMSFDNSYDAPQTLTLQKDWESGFCVRLKVQDDAGVLERIAGVFAANGLSIHSVMQRGDDKSDGFVTIVIITHNAKELALQTAVENMRELDCVSSIDSVIHVER